MENFCRRCSTYLVVDYNLSDRKLSRHLLMDKTTAKFLTLPLVTIKNQLATERINDTYFCHLVRIYIYIHMVSSQLILSLAAVCLSDGISNSWTASDDQLT